MYSACADGEFVNLAGKFSSQLSDLKTSRFITNPILGVIIVLIKEIENLILQSVDNIPKEPIKLSSLEDLILKNVPVSSQGMTNEHILQIYLNIHKNEIFPTIKQVLSYEQALYKNRTDLGKYDFLFLTLDNQLLIVETKFIDTLKSSKTAKLNRSYKRQKVINQVIKRKNTIHKLFNIPLQFIHCAVFTTDPSLQNKTDEPIIIRSLSIHDFNTWKKNFFSE